MKVASNNMTAERVAIPRFSQHVEITQQIP